MFVGFLYHLRAFGLRVTTTEWLTFMEALVRGHARCDVEVFYELGRALLVKREALQAVGKYGGRLRLCGLSPAVKNLFKLSNLISIFDIRETREDAVR